MKPIVKAPTQSSISDLERDNRLLARKAAQEGIVLLKNNGVLPLKSKTISLYGAGARKTIHGGTGSGAMHERYSVGIEEGLENAGFIINSKKWIDKYDEYYEKQYADWESQIEELVEGITDFMSALGIKKSHEFKYPTGLEITNEYIESTESSVAIYVISRQAGEADDRKLEKGDYYLDDTEVRNLKKLRDFYKDVVVVINSGSAIDTEFFNEIGVSALIFYSQAGEEGGNALADIISGKVSPSAKLTNTWAKIYTDYPSAGNFSIDSNPIEQNYVEGIYVGYRYFDTFNVEPRYPFGYGLSYTDFEIKQKDLKFSNKEIKQKVLVKNIGSLPGKEVIQTYSTFPDSGLATEFQRLVAFTKTNTLKPGESQEIELTFPIKRLTQYDENSSAYKLYKGEYILKIGNSSRKTRNSGKVEINKTIIYEQCTPINKPINNIKQKEPLYRKETSPEDIETCEINIDEKTKIHSYNELPVFNDKNVEQFIKGLSNEDLARLVVGGDVRGDRLVTVLGASGSSTSKLYSKYGIPNIILSDGPAGLNVTPELVELPSGEIKSTVMYEQYNFGIFKKAMKRKIGNKKDGTPRYQYATAWPASIVLAQTWNTELLREVGTSTGKEMENLGVTIWLAPGMNIHRNPLGGRTFEYYSEDPVLSGKMAAAITNGVQSISGKGVSLKHFAANNSEILRHQSSSNMSEKTLREIYLKGFEVALEESKPLTIMASYNKINGIYNTNNYDLLVKVLRNEWGYEGVVISDWEAIDNNRANILKAHHAQCDLIMPGTENQVQILKKAIEEKNVDIKDIQRSAGRILKLISKNSIVPYKMDK